MQQSILDEEQKMLNIKEWGNKKHFDDLEYFSKKGFMEYMKPVLSAEHLKLCERFSYVLETSFPVASQQSYAYKKLMDCFQLYFAHHNLF